MTALREDAMDLLEKMPEDKAFEELERLRKKVPELDYNKELENYREEKYGILRTGKYPA